MNYKISKQGVSFPYAGDTITRFWPWVNSTGQSRYRSFLYATDFNNFREYWKMCGKAEVEFAQTGNEKLKGFRLYEVLGEWSRSKYPAEFILILKGVDVSRKGPTFWARLSDAQVKAFGKDLVVMRCKDKTQAAVLLESISLDFAEAFVFKDGLLIDTNLWTD